MRQDAATRDTSRLALFIDIDGPIREFAESQLSHPSDYLGTMLQSLCTKHDGALALLSRRRVADIDTLLAPHRFCCAGVRGCETRDIAGRVWTEPVDSRVFDGARAILSQLIGRYPGLLLEDTGCGLALHFGHEPDLRVLAGTAMKSAAEVLGPGFRLRASECAYDIHPAKATQATAIAAFMEQAPFRGRTPVCIGDDATDPHAFALVNHYRGFPVKVGASSPRGEASSMAALIDAIRWLDISPASAPHGSCNCGWNPRDF